MIIAATALLTALIVAWSLKYEKKHRYLSTACWHAIHDDSEEMHNQCRQTCKFCVRPCRCRCHKRDQVRAQLLAGA